MPKDPPTVEELKEALSSFRLKPGCTLQQIKKRKSFLTKTLHEDVVASELKEEAREEMIQVNAAWEVIDAWFKANPGATATPSDEGNTKTESGRTESKAGSGGETSSDPDFDDEDPEDWNNWKNNVQNRWTGQTSSLEQLDAKRRRDIIVNARREFIVKCKWGVAVVILVGIVFAADSINVFTVWNITVIAFLIWQFHPKAKEATEKWIEME